MKRKYIELLDDQKLKGKQKCGSPNAADWVCEVAVQRFSEHECVRTIVSLTTCVES